MKKLISETNVVIIVLVGPYIYTMVIELDYTYFKIIVLMSKLLNHYIFTYDIYGIIDKK